MSQLNISRQPSTYLLTPSFSKFPLPKFVTPLTVFCSHLQELLAILHGLITQFLPLSFYLFHLFLLSEGTTAHFCWFYKLSQFSWFKVYWLYAWPSQLGGFVDNPKLQHLQVLNNRSLTITRLPMFIILMKEISSRDNIRSNSKGRF